MKITFLGHAGFLVDCGTDKILCDPWFDPRGAYAASWFPFPANDHIDLTSLERATHLYISHWHRDHFDEWFLRSRSEEFKSRVTVVIAQFRYPKLEEWIRDCGYSNIQLVETDTIFETESGTEMLIQSDENPLYTDSSISIRSGGRTFVNMNDCKLSLAQEKKIFETFGAVDVLAAQYSGATFHPTCYDYSAERKREISRARRAGKFKRILSSIELLQAKAYIPSAGPACFLSDDLRHLNLNSETVFSSFSDLNAWLKQNSRITTSLVHLAPGDSRDASISALRPSSDLASHYQSQDYIESYASRRRGAIQQAQSDLSRVNDDLLERAKSHFKELLQLVPELALRANVVIRLQITAGTVHGTLKETFYIDTAMRRISDSDPNRSLQYYTLRIPDQWMQALCDRKISWEDYILSFRLGISREPDIYNEAFVAFLQLETAEERVDYLAYLHAQENLPQERVTRECDGRMLTHLRFCPHNGEDLSDAPIENGVLTCPRHFWQYDLNQNGKGLNNPCTLRVEWQGIEAVSE
jgi:UDP-MurNAc hydroxylase